MHLRTVALCGDPIPSWVVNTLTRRCQFLRWRDDKGLDRDHTFNDDNNGGDDNDNIDTDGTNFCLSCNSKHWSTFHYFSDRQASLMNQRSDDHFPRKLDLLFY